MQQANGRNRLRYAEATSLAVHGLNDEEGADLVVGGGEIWNPQRLSHHGCHEHMRHHVSGAAGGRIDRTQRRHEQTRRDTRRRSRHSRRRSTTPTSGRRRGTPRLGTRTTPTKRRQRSARRRSSLPATLAARYLPRVSTLMPATWTQDHLPREK